MEDDGLLLNFTTSSNPVALNGKKLAALQGKKPKGSWRDRREAHRATGYEKSYNQDAPLPAFPKPSGSKPGHRPGGVSKRSTQSVLPTKTPLRKLKEGEVPKEGIVSSLFTYNPKIEQNPKSESKEEGSSAQSTNAPLQVHDGFAVNPTMQKYLADKMGLDAPTRIQRSGIPGIATAAQSKKDVVMVAQTGSGKTLAYLLPIIDDLMNSPEHINRTSGIHALILAPTRELASQIYQVCETLCKCCHYIVPGLVIGGEKKKSEKARLRKGVNILIGTPGRMADHVDNTMRLSFRKTKFVVLDEGDRLIDLGFEEALTQILAAVSSERTSVLCSATMNAQASRLKTLVLSDPVIWVREQPADQSGKSDFGAENTPGQLVQRLAIVPAKLRLVTLAALCSYINARSKRGIVFFSCTDSVDFHYRVLGSNMGKLQVFKLHGNMTQQLRTETITKFSKSMNYGSGSILLTTDVASRGLDVIVDEVVEYDPPFTIEDHLHRAGRTARAGRKGEALMLLLPSEKAYEETLRKAHAGSIKTETYQSLLQRGFGFKTWQDDATAWQLKIEKAVLASTDDIATAAKAAFTAHIRAYTTHTHGEKAIFNFRELHLGHLAKAFALREPPGSISFGGGPALADPKQKRKSPRQAMLEAAERQMNMDEYNVM